MQRERLCANSIVSLAWIVSLLFTSTIPRPPAAHASIDMNTSAKAGLAWMLFASSCVTAVSAKSRKCWKHRRERTYART